MKKILCFFFIFLFLFSPTHLKANQSVIVSAVVGNINHAPVILSVIPDSNPRFLRVNRTQSYTLYFRDNEKDTVSYTMTPANGFTHPISGTIEASNYDASSWAYINFLYLAPSIPVENETITLTINDGSNVISKELHLYIY